MVGIFKAKYSSTREPERAKMAAKPPIFASVLKNLNVKSLIFSLSFNFLGQEMGP